MVKAARSLVVGAIALIVFSAIGFAAGYLVGKQRVIQAFTPKSSIGPQQQSGVVSAFKDKTLEITDPQTQELTKITIDDATTIRLTDKNGVFQVADTSAFIKGSIVLITIDGNVQRIDVISPVQSNK